jgi:hypothetical protein
MDGDPRALLFHHVFTSPRATCTPSPRAAEGYSLNAAMAFSPLFTVTLFDFVAPLAGRHVTA